mgnify:CR=1 FL=1
MIFAERFPRGALMLILARVLSVLSLMLSALAIDSWRLHILPLGFEGTGYVAGSSFVFAVLASLTAIAIMLVRPNSKSDRAHVVLLAGISLMALGVLVAICPGGC